MVGWNCCFAFLEHGRIDVAVLVVKAVIVVGKKKDNKVRYPTFFDLSLKYQAYIKGLQGFLNIQ